MMTSVVDNGTGRKAPHRRRPGRRQDRDGGERPATATTPGSSASPPPTTRRSPSPSSSSNGGAHRRRHLRADRQDGHPGLPRRAGRADGAGASAACSPAATRSPPRSPPAAWARSGRPATGCSTAIVAAKVLKSEYTGDPSFLARFRNEARHTAALTHPNIASVYDYGETVDDSGTQQLAFLVMEFVEGQPLVTILHDEGALPVDWTLHVLGQSADGLSAAHRAGVVHRDIKPGNLHGPSGRRGQADRLRHRPGPRRHPAHPHRHGRRAPRSTSPPSRRRGMEVTAASDVYSLGVVGYECLAGRRPVRRRLPGGDRAGAHQPAAAAAARPRPAGRAAARSSARWPRTPPTASPTAARSPRPSGGWPPAARWRRGARRRPRRPPGHRRRDGAADAGARRPAATRRRSAAGAPR